jgi:hypothetical protein
MLADVSLVPPSNGTRTNEPLVPMLATLRAAGAAITELPPDVCGSRERRRLVGDGGAVERSGDSGGFRCRFGVVDIISNTGMKLLLR